MAGLGLWRTMVLGTGRGQARYGGGSLIRIMAPASTSQRCLKQRFPSFARTSASSSSSRQTNETPPTTTYYDSLPSLLRELDRVRPKVVSCLGLLDRESCERELVAMEAEASAPGLWDQGQGDHGDRGDHGDGAAALLRDMSSLRRRIDLARSLEGLLGDVSAAVELMGDGPGSDESLIGEASEALGALGALVERWEVEKLLEGPFDRCCACVTIQAGAGGTDAQDWAQMLERMYTRYAERRGFRASVLERSAGEEAGIKSCALQVEGDFAFGWLCGEKGTHRLVRLSPFNAKQARQTSFAAVEVTPIVEDKAKLDSVEVAERDLEWSTMRSGGKGGQNVNKVESAVRVRHLPTGLAVKCTEERSQQMNRAKALSILKSKLLVMENERREEELARIRGEAVVADFGQQVRTYVLHPYRMVKDLRTGVETSGADDVLDGSLDDFAEAYLNYRAANKDNA